MPRRKTNPVTVFSDRLLRVSLVVELPDGSLWMVPDSPDGWRRRARLTMTADARRDRLARVKRDVSHLGLPDSNKAKRGAK